MENLAEFNQDMSLIALNVYQIYNMFDIVKNENQELLSWMGQLERETIKVEERQSDIEQKIEALSGELDDLLSQEYSQQQER